MPQNKLEKVLLQRELDKHNLPRTKSDNPYDRDRDGVPVRTPAKDAYDSRPGRGMKKKDVNLPVERKK